MHTEPAVKRCYLSTLVTFVSYSLSLASTSVWSKYASVVFFLLKFDLSSTQLLFSSSAVTMISMIGTDQFNFHFSSSASHSHVTYTLSYRVGDKKHWHLNSGHLFKMLSNSWKKDKITARKCKKNWYEIKRVSFFGLHKKLYSSLNLNRLSNSDSTEAEHANHVRVKMLKFAGREDGHTQKCTSHWSK